MGGHLAGLGMDVKWDTRAFSLFHSSRFASFFIFLRRNLVSRPLEAVTVEARIGVFLGHDAFFAAACDLSRLGFACLVFILYSIVSRVEAASENGRLNSREWVDDGYWRGRHATV